MVQALSCVVSLFKSELQLTYLDVLKFEYLTQLLLDANYLPLILKLFAHQDIDVAVSQRNDRSDLEYVLK